MRKSKYDFWVDTQPIVPPVAGIYKYVAFARICKNGKGVVNHNINEIRGRTKGKVIEKMEKEIEKWLAKNDY